MKYFWKLPLLASALALTTTLSGCGNNAEPAHPTDTTMTLDAEKNAATPTGATPGTPAKAGPFEVTLALAAPEPKVGDAQFKATVTRDGKPVTDATVTLELSMPQMNMGGPTAPLAHTSGGVYAGKANLSMGGAYSAKVNVSAGDASGDALYEFRAVQ